ncbi:hypothetical protein C8R43DRAFT_1235326 [Mycena crocata]|nr:hypothetical protein C8R43DRAFT_1235326 [Mycena crocata]
MSKIARISLDVLSEIMILHPSTIEEKFAFSQVSRLWRNLALATPLLWSSFTCMDETDCNRLPVVLERSGATAGLHIRLRFSDPFTHWPSVALEALLPYAARIETLDAEFRPRIAFDAMRLLNSNVDFPALQTLRLQNFKHGSIPIVLLSAPKLRVLDVQQFASLDWNSILVPTLEVIRLVSNNHTNLGTLSHILTQCPLVRHVVLHSHDGWDDADEDSLAHRDDFNIRSPVRLAPALRELELQLIHRDIRKVLENGFADVVLPAVTACTLDDDLNHVTPLADVMLSGLGVLTAFSSLDSSAHIELRDAARHIRRFEGYNAQEYLSTTEIASIWKHLSTRYGLHHSVREIRIHISAWDAYAAGFAAYPPQSDVTLTLLGSALRIENVDFASMLIPGLVKVQFNPDESRSCDRNARLDIPAILRILSHIEGSPAQESTQVCIGERGQIELELDMELNVDDWDDADLEDTRRQFRVAGLSALQAALSAPWVLCSHLTLSISAAPVAGTSKDLHILVREPEPAIAAAAAEVARAPEPEPGCKMYSCICLCIATSLSLFLSLFLFASPLFTLGVFPPTRRGCVPTHDRTPLLPPVQDLAV